MKKRDKIRYSINGKPLGREKLFQWIVENCESTDDPKWYRNTQALITYLYKGAKEYGYMDYGIVSIKTYTYDILRAEIEKEEEK